MGFAQIFTEPANNLQQLIQIWYWSGSWSESRNAFKAKNHRNISKQESQNLSIFKAWQRSALFERLALQFSF